MNCADCSERLPDFLLDELPESEAVLVQEHLALCSSCQAIYRELKGTGTALSAVPSMRAVTPTGRFTTAVLTAARVESMKILQTLPPERRLRVEVRRASRRASRRQTQASPPARHAFSTRVLLAVLCAAAGVAAVLFLYPRPGQGGARRDLGVLSVSVGKVEQFYEREHTHWTPARLTAPVRAGDVFATGEDGRARFDLYAGGAVLAGPRCDLRFLTLEEGRELALELRAGQLGLERPAPAGQSKAESAPGWSVRVAGAEVSFPPGAWAYLRVEKEDGTRAHLRVVSGQVQVQVRRGKPAAIEAGEARTLSASGIQSPTVPGESGMPVWRADLVTNSELARCFAGAPTVVERRPEGVVVELAYRSGQAEFLASAQKDWSADKPGRALAVTASGALRVPTETRFVLAVLLAPPLSADFTVASETPREAAWAFAALDSPARGISCDLGADGCLQVRAGDHSGGGRIAYRQSSAEERVRLEVSWSGNDLRAQLSTKAGKTASIPVVFPAGQPASGAVWFSAVGEGVVFESITVRGLLPSNWLRNRLTAQ